VACSLAFIAAQTSVMIRLYLNTIIRVNHV
jgi:hypothetical protein